jgi:hypothetical protein
LQKQDIQNGASALSSNINVPKMKAVKGSAGITLALDSLEQKENTQK